MSERRSPGSAGAGLRGWPPSHTASTRPPPCAGAEGQRPGLRAVSCWLGRTAWTVSCRSFSGLGRAREPGPSSDTQAPRRHGWAPCPCLEGPCCSPLTPHPCEANSQSRRDRGDRQRPKYSGQEEALGGREEVWPSPAHPLTAGCRAAPGASRGRCPQGTSSPWSQAPRSQTQSRVQARRPLSTGEGVASSYGSAVRQGPPPVVADGGWPCWRGGLQELVQSALCVALDPRRPHTGPCWPAPQSGHVSPATVAQPPPLENIEDTLWSRGRGRPGSPRLSPSAWSCWLASRGV